MGCGCKNNLLKFSIWGPVLWKFLHGICYNIENKNVNLDREIYELLSMLPLIIPCPVCQNHAKTHILEYPIPRDIREINIWLFTFHNRVRERKSQKIIISNMESYYKFYSDYNITKDIINQILNILEISVKQNIVSDYNLFICKNLIDKIINILNII